MTMIEKVARAIVEKAYRWDDLSGAMQFHYKQMAKVAIQAMREPTEEMIKSGITSDYHGYSVKHQYQLMIEAALKE